MSESLHHEASGGASGRFAWIVTVYNKERLLPRVLRGIGGNMGPGDRVVIVLDGCTDRSPEHAERFRSAQHGVDVRIITTPDLHELGAINAGLAALERERFAGVFIVQDDVVLLSRKLAEAVTRLQELEHGRVGAVSFRMGSYLSGATEGIPFWQDFVESCFGHRAPRNRRLRAGRAVAVDLVFKSPIFYTRALLDHVDWHMDEVLMPHSMDDLDMSLHARTHGLRNFAVALPMRSDLPWGGTREFEQVGFDDVGNRNAHVVLAKHREFVAAAALEPRVPGRDHPQIRLLGRASRAAELQAVLGMAINSFLMRPVPSGRAHAFDQHARAAVWRLSNVT
jgi:hypothetical protein